MWVPSLVVDSQPSEWRSIIGYNFFSSYLLLLVQRLVCHNRRIYRLLNLLLHIFIPLGLFILQGTEQTSILLFTNLFPASRDRSLASLGILRSSNTLSHKVNALEHCLTITANYCVNLTEIYHNYAVCTYKHSPVTKN